MVEKRECQNPSCGRFFNFIVKPSTKPSWGKYCSRSCYYESVAGKTEERKCQSCGTVFELKVKLSTQPSDGKYCSQFCQRGSQTTGKIEKRECQKCGVVFNFNVRPSTRSYEGKYCSTSCLWNSQVAGKIEKRKCQSCGNIFNFYVAPSTKPGAGKYCSTSCYNNSQIKRIVGETKTCGACKKLLFSENYSPSIWTVVKLCSKECIYKKSEKPIGSVRENHGYLIEKVGPEHPFYYTMQSEKRGWILQHRLVMAEYLGRPLFDWETVHHIDRNPQNNDIKNLQLRIGAHGEGATYRCTDCDSDRIHPVKI